MVNLTLIAGRGINCKGYAYATTAANTCNGARMKNMKYDEGKPKLTLCPTDIITAVARVREYGVKKYGDSDSWKDVEPQRYRDAAFRHFVSYINDPSGADEESGLPHLWHLACNIAFLCAMEKD